MTACEKALELAAIGPEGLVPHQAETLRDHLAACPPCRTAVEDLEALRRLAAGHAVAVPTMRNLPRRNPTGDWLRTAAAMAAGILLTLSLGRSAPQESAVPMPDAEAFRARLAAEAAPPDVILVEMPSPDPGVSITVAYRTTQGGAP